MTLLPTVREQLTQAVRDAGRPGARVPGAERSGGRGRIVPWLRQSRLSAGNALAAASLLLALVIGAGALLAVGRQRPAPPAAAQRVQPALRVLTAHFSVLRRPQTAADQSTQLLPTPFGIPALHPAPERSFARLGYPELERSLIRVISLPKLDAQVAFDPATWRLTWRSSRRAAGLYLVMHIGTASTFWPVQQFGSGPEPTSVATLLAHGLAITNPHVAEGLSDGVLVVPDGVARVTLRPVRLVGLPAPIGPAAYGSVTATVSHNLALFQLPIPVAITWRTASGVYSARSIAEATWYGPSGTIIKRTTTSVDVFVTVRGKGPSPTSVVVDGKGRSTASTRLQRHARCHRGPAACRLP